MVVSPLVFLLIHHANNISRISSLANVDHRLLEALQRLRDSSWTYGAHSGTRRPLLMELAQDLGYPADWGDPYLLPPFGGPVANEQWKALGVTGRGSVGGLPCEIIHGGAGKMLSEGSCLANAVVRGSTGFLQAMLIYLPVSADCHIPEFISDNSFVTVRYISYQ